MPDANEYTSILKSKASNNNNNNNNNNVTTAATKTTTSATAAYNAGTGSITTAFMEQAGTGVGVVRTDSSNVILIDANNNGSSLSLATTASILNTSANKDDETSNISNSNGNFKVYWTRWYILGLYSLVGAGQNMVYSTWGSIADAAQPAMHFTQTDIGLLPNWYNISYFISIIPFIWIVNQRGLRTAVLATAALSALGASIRCLSVGDPESDRYIIHLGQMINGLASPIPWFGGTQISALWFPPNERPMATSIGLASGSLGVAASFLVGPYFIQWFAPDDADGNAAPDWLVRLAISKLLHFEALYMLVMLVFVIVFFPSKPPTQPSYTAGLERAPFLTGLLQLVSNFQAWILLSVYAVSSAVYASWTQILSLFVAPIMDEIEAGWLGFSITMVSIFAGPILSLTSSWWLERHSKLVCVILLIIGNVFLAMMVLSALLFQRFFTRSQVWATLNLSQALLLGAQPIWWEMACEASYPVSESVVSGIFTLGSCFVSWIFFFLYMFPELGTEWSTWALLVSEVICVPVLLLYKPTSVRSAHDASSASLATATALGGSAPPSSPQPDDDNAISFGHDNDNDDNDNDDERRILKRSRRKSRGNSNMDSLLATQSYQSLLRRQELLSSNIGGV